MAQRPVQMLATGHEKLKGHLAMMLFAALIAGSFSIGHLAAPHIGAAALNVIRFVFACAVMGGFVLAFSRGRITPPAAIWRYGILGGLLAIYFVLMFVALKITDPVSTGAVFTLIPLMSAGFGWLFLRQTTRPIVVVSLLIAATGAVWVIFGGNWEAVRSFQIGNGEMIFFVGCAAYAASSPLVPRLRRAEPIMEFTLWTLTGALFWLVLVGGVQLANTQLSALPAIVWFAVVYLAIFTTAGTIFLLQFASVRLPSSKVLAYGYLTPVFVILIEGFIGHGWVSISVLAGALVTAIALLVMALAPDQ